MFKRLATTSATLTLTYVVLGSIVFMGVPLSSRLLGQWRVVEVFGSDLSQALSPLTIRFDKDGRLVGRSSCGTFRGRWSTGPDRVHFVGLAHAEGRCGEQGAEERQVMEAMAGTREARMEQNGMVLMHQGRPVARLIPHRT